MGSAPQTVVYASPDELAGSVAERLAETLQRLQSDPAAVPSVALTGGTIAIRIHEAVAAGGFVDRVDWRRVEFWFGDERYVPADDPERNAGQAQAAMLDHLDVDPGRVHPMPASDGQYGDDVDAAAAAYADELVSAGTSGDPPTIDVLMLGVGPDGHCASLFPGRAEQRDPRPVIAVRESPKPPPIRISLTMAQLNRAREVWFVASGEGKAEAVASAVHGADPLDVPAAGPHGLEQTLWLLDAAAAAHL